MVVKVLIIVVFAAVTVGIGLACRKKSGSVGDFVLGGRNVGPWLTAFAYGTSYFSSVVFVGYAGQFGWDFGISATWIGIGNALIGSLLAWVVLGRRTRVMTKHLEASTMPEFFESRYASKGIKLAAAVIIFVFLVPYSASVYKGLSELFSMAFNVDFRWCVWGIALLTAVYVIAGGYTAAAVNDFVQGIIMLGGIVLVIIAVLNGRGGFTAAVSELSKVSAQSAPQLQGAYVSFFGPEPLKLLSVMLMTSLGAWGLPQMVHKFYTIRNEKAVHTGTIISTVFALVIAGGSYFMGAFARLYHVGDKVSYDLLVPQMLGSVLSDALLGIVLVLVLSASLSTLSSLVITSSSTFTLDILKLALPKLSGKVQVGTIRALCGAFVLLSALIALNPTSLISSLMALSWGALAGSFLGPLIYGLFWRGTTKAGVAASFVTGIGITCGNYVTGLLPPTMASAIAILVSLVVVPLVSIVSRKLDPAFVSGVFSCYNERISVKHAAALKEDDEDTAKNA